MANKTRKHIWPVALMSLAVFGVLAAIVALSVAQTGVAQAHPCDEGTIQERAACDTEHENAGLDSTDPNHDRPDASPPTLEPTPEPSTINDGTSSPGGSVKLELTITSLPMDMAAGSSIEVFLEDDYQVPDSIDEDDVYFIVTNPKTDATNDGGRVNPTDMIEIDDDDHFGGDDDWSIQVFIPDMNTGDNFDGFNGPMEEQTLQPGLHQGRRHQGSHRRKGLPGRLQGPGSQR